MDPPGTPLPAGAASAPHVRFSPLFRKIQGSFLDDGSEVFG